MTTKGKRTKEMILHEAAKVFNQRGYWGTSIADLVDATGLERGGIYNHFANKDEIAIAAFDYAYDYISHKLLDRINQADHAADKLKTIATSFVNILDNPELPGGCAILNTAIVADDTHPDLRTHVQAAINELQEEIQNIVRQGIADNELHPETNEFSIAVVMISTLEGGVMMSKLHGDETYLQTAIQFLHNYIDANIRL